jgi:hypothetical protein
LVFPIGPPHDKYGRTYLNAGIKFLFEYPDGFRLCGEVEGFEYIVNRESSSIHGDTLFGMYDFSRDKSPNFTEYEIDKSILTIDATTPDKNRYHSKFIILDVVGGFIIINKYSTKKYLKMIDAINRSTIAG